MAEGTTPTREAKILNKVLTVRIACDFCGKVRGIGKIVKLRDLKKLVSDMLMRFDPGSRLEHGIEVKITNSCNCPQALSAPVGKKRLLLFEIVIP